MNFSRVNAARVARSKARYTSEYQKSDFPNVVAAVARDEIYPEGTPSSHSEFTLRVLAVVEGWPQKSAD